ncbi:membrane protein [Colletotrichum karsti]|uniref:Membrane protein n=1 Tax=Colletotrichum karsti TaxID=1095194 RepID=A0A9P6LD01_9PEZI|nr:uncharacterized protein CkaCkLH20_12161 [Colletotrichum karsti]KAF9870314.1 membrane protein [Colletotrichum karsti]
MADPKPINRRDLTNLTEFDLVQRGVKEPSVPGILTFIGLRGLDPFLQYKLLAGGWGTSILARLGVKTIGPVSALSTSGIPPHLILLGLSFASAAKQSYWVTNLCAEKFEPGAALHVSTFNTVCNSLSSLLFLAASTSSLSSPVYHFPGTALPYQVILGAALSILGMALESASEVQRKRFKAKPENEDKVCREGPWDWARHINYGAHVIWHAGYWLAASGWVAGLSMGMFQALDFVVRGVPVLDDYCAKRYGEQWSQFKKDVKWAMIPGIY